MNRTIKEATVRRYHYDDHQQLHRHLGDFVAAYNFGRRLKTLKGLTPYEFICKAWQKRAAPLHPQPAPPNAGTKHVLSGIIRVIRNGLRWRDAPAAYGPHKTLYNRFVRWSRLGVFSHIFAALAGAAGQPERIMIDSTHLKAHRTAASLRQKGHRTAASPSSRTGAASPCATTAAPHTFFSAITFAATSSSGCENES